MKLSEWDSEIMIGDEVVIGNVESSPKRWTIGRKGKVIDRSDYSHGSYVKIEIDTPIPSFLIDKVVQIRVKDVKRV